MLDSLKEEVCRANQALKTEGLAVLTWGNASGMDRERGIIAIKPSGVNYADLTPHEIVLVDLEGKTVEGTLKPSSDLPTHLALYRGFPAVGGVVHTHSSYATMFAQAQRGVPCFGTTHADHFTGEVPVTRPLTEQEVTGDYETATGNVIVERFAGLDPMHTPAVLVACHGPFTWGTNVQEALHNAIALEEIAKIAFGTLTIHPSAACVPQFLLQKHFGRKHGPEAYYGQKKPPA